MSRIRAMVVITLLDINDSQHQQYNAKILTKYFLWSWNVDKNSNIENQNCVLFDEKKMLHIPGRQAGSLQVPSPWKWDCFLSVAQERYFCVQMNALLGTLSSGISLVVDFAQEWRTLQVIWGRLFCLYLQLRSWLPPLQSRVNINWYEIYQKLPCETRSSSSSVMPMSDRLALTLDTSFSSSNASIRLERLWSTSTSANISGSTSTSCVNENVVFTVLRGKKLLKIPAKLHLCFLHHLQQSFDEVTGIHCSTCNSNKSERI